MELKVALMYDIVKGDKSARFAYRTHYHKNISENTSLEFKGKYFLDWNILLIIKNNMQENIFGKNMLSTQALRHASIYMQWV